MLALGAVVSLGALGAGCSRRGGANGDAGATADGALADRDGPAAPDAAPGGDAAPTLDAALAGPDAAVALPCPGAEDVIDLTPLAGVGIVALPRVHWTGSHYLYSWHGGPTAAIELQTAHVSAAGALAPGSIRTASPDDGHGSQFGRLASAGSQYGVVYSDDRDTTPMRRVYFARLDVVGAPVPGSELPVATPQGTQDYPAIAWDPDDEQWGVAWFDVHDSTSDVMFARFSAAGALIAGSQVEVSSAFSYGYVSDSGGSPLVWNGTRFALAWNTGGSIVISELATDGSAQTNIPLAVTGAMIPDRPTIAWDGAGYGVVWMSWDFGHYRVHFGRADGAGWIAGSDVALGDEVDYSGEPSVVWTGSDYAVAWGDEIAGAGGAATTGHIWTARFDAAGALEPGTRRALTCADAIDWFSTIDWNGDRLAIPYERYSPDGSPTSEGHLLLLPAEAGPG